nr:protein transport protein Sec16B isoform X2 [Halyomorpha halys]
MSTEFNEWDWNNTDWKNGWTNTVPQNFNRPPPKETGPSSHVSQHNRGPTNEAYEKGWDDWSHPNHGSEVRGHASTNVFSTINNNMLNQVENREIAPPDNKHSYETTKFKSKPSEISNFSSQHHSNIAPVSKAFQVQHVPQTGAKQQTNHINDYFEPKPVNQNISAQPNLFYSQPMPDGYNAQMISSGPSSFSNLFPPHQQQMEREAEGFSSLGHHVNSSQASVMKQIPIKDEVNQNIDNRAKRFTPSPQQRNPITPPMQMPPPSINPNHHTIPPPEAHDSNGIVKMNPNIGNPPSYQVTNINIMAPIAASSPIASHSTLLPENQERIPDNREYPDNTENIAQDLKALSINPAKEQAEQETQKHCAVDRNQYLETGHFSSRKESNTYLQNTENNDEGEAPPPGLHRLVTGQGCEPWKVEMDNWLEKDVNQVPATPSVPSLTRHSSPLSSIGESETRDDEKERRREVPGEAEPLQGRVVLGQVPTPPQDAPTARGERERERLERMVVGEQVQSGGNTSDDYRQPGRQKRHQRHRRADSSYEEEERDYSSDRDRRNEDHRRRDDRPRRRREQRSPEYRSDEEYEERRSFHRSGRESRRTREYSPDRSYYRDYRDYRGDDSRSHRRYYGREYDDYYRENQRSRPSSRSGSDYRHQIKHSMRMMHGHYYHDLYPAGAPAFHDYNLKYSQRTAEYFERMRHIDPAGYAAWYSQYMQGRFGQESSGRAFSSDRASVHSGQSSSHQRQGISTPQEIVDDLTREEEVDYTPRLYDSAHIRGNMDGQGRLIVVDPHYPLDKQRATVNICHLSQISLDSDTEDFFQSPGPFIPGVTHRNTVLQYLKRISDRSVKSSEKLLYDLIHMTVKGNGEVNGSDVAELLMDSYKKSIQNGNESGEEAAGPPAVSSKKVTARFRELLQQGNKTEALDWAIDNDAWGHALFLASKMDERTHNNIMLRFANSIAHNDPLQTLYQLMSGFVPQAATCCADKKWSDWRPHLAMILSNPTGNANLDRQAIITLGDSLNASGRLFASHFCYVTAQVEFSEFRPDAQLVLLGSSPNQEFSKFASCRAIMLTMCYEYGLKLRQPLFSIPTLQVYKLILAARLIDSGRIRNALQYCEFLAQEMLSGTAPVVKSLLTTVIDFSLRLKMFDPVLALSGNTERDPDWLSSLKQLSRNLPDEYTPRSNNCSPLAAPEPNPNNDFLQETYKVPDEQKSLYSEPVPMINTMEQQVFQPPQMPIPQKSGRPQFQPEVSENIYHQGFAPPPSMPSGYKTGHGVNSEVPGPIEITSGSGPDQQWGEQGRVHSAVIQPTEAPQSQRNSFFKTTEEQLKLNEVGGDKKKDTKGPESKTKNEEQSSGWFGGIWEKIAMRPKNQMRLPDDSNPSIIWDEQKKKWVNLDGESESGGSVKPPPKVTEYVPPQNSNKYKIQKGKLMKSNYVDVMGNNDKNETLPPANLVPSVPTVMKTNYFIPPPVEGNENAPIDFISPAPAGPILPDSSDNSKQQLSRCSSVSSLSREVQYYMAPGQAHFQHRLPGNSNHPAVYNPARFPS